MPNLIASRYDGLPVDPTLAYFFETQEGIPVDGRKQRLSEFDPFTIRILPPEIIESTSGVDVNLIGRGTTTTQVRDQTVSAVRAMYGIPSTLGDPSSGALSLLQRSVSAGQIVSGSTLTERAAFVDNLTALDIVYQVERILQTPPLTLLVPPKSMTIAYSQVQQYQQRSREGYIFERWGENNPTISFSGTTGGFIAGAPSGYPLQTETSVASGLQYASKKDSAAFQNFISLYQFYRNNGYIYDLVKGSRSHLMIGALAIDYDNWTYVGHMTNFSYSYQQDMAHRLEWSMDFVVDRMYDNGMPPGMLAAINQTSPPTPYSVQGVVSRGGFVQVTGEFPFDLI